MRDEKVGGCGIIDFGRMRELMRTEERLYWALIRERSKAEKSTAAWSSNGGGGKGRKSSRVEDGGIALAIIQEEYDQIAEELKQQRKELRGKIKKLPERQRTIIRMRYIGGISCRQIADDLHYDRFYMHHLIRIAEQQVNELQDTTKSMDEDANTSQ